MKPKHQYILRAIGQGLENLEVKLFELEFSDGCYWVSGNCKKTKAPVEEQPGLAKAFLRLIRNSRRKTTGTPDLPFHFSGLRFGPPDIDALDRKGKALRSSSSGYSTDPDSISQVLRMTGAYLDYKRGSLLRISWQQPILKLWYLTARGIEAREEFSPPDLYDLWVHQFKKRESYLKPTGSD